MYIRTCAQPAHPHSLIRVFTGHSVGSQGSNAFSGGQRRLRSACADAQADLSLRWMHMQSFKKCCTPAHLKALLRRTKNQCAHITSSKRGHGRPSSPFVFREFVWGLCGSWINIVFCSSHVIPTQGRPVLIPRPTFLLLGAKRSTCTIVKVFSMTQSRIEPTTSRSESGRFTN